MAMEIMLQYNIKEMEVMLQYNKKKIIEEVTLLNNLKQLKSYWKLH